MERIQINTTSCNELLQITSLIESIVYKKDWESGALLVYCPHTTAAITINESADPDVVSDILRYMRMLVPENTAFAHVEGNSDAHIKTSFFGAHCMLIVENNRIMKGTWQGVYFCEWDGPREREVWLQFLPNC